MKIKKMIKREKQKQNNSNREKNLPLEIKKKVEEAKKELAKKGYTNIHYLARGKRGIVFYAKKNSREVCIKYSHPWTKKNTLKNEFLILNYLKNLKIAPQPLLLEDNFLLMEYIKGEIIKDFLEDISKEYKTKSDKIKKQIKKPDWIRKNRSLRDNIILLIWELIDYMIMLDLLGINKQEMNHPHKHIIIRKKALNKSKQEKRESHSHFAFTPVLVDFERAKYSNNPKNLSQFISYLCSNRVKEALTKVYIEVNETELKMFITWYKKEIKEREVSHKKLLAPPTRKEVWRSVDEKLKELITKIKLAVFLTPIELRDRVLIEASKIPKGKCCSYSLLAQRSGTSSPRRVGSIVANNPFNPIVPCHRVIKANRELGSFQHKKNNPLKKKLLEKEGVETYNKEGKFYVKPEFFLG